MSTPAVSVLIPVRNAAPTLRAALATLRAQTFGRWEGIVVDDGSTDDSADILNDAARCDARLTIVRIAPSGIDRALNHGLAHCTAAYVARFDADDLMHRDRLGEQWAALEADPSLSGVAGLVRCFPRRTLRDGLRRYETWLNGLVAPPDVAAARFVESPLVHPSVMVRRTALESCGGWRDVSWAEDWDLWLRMLHEGHRFAKVPRVVHFWRDRPERLTRTDSRYSVESMMKARAHYLARGPLNGHPGVIWGAGPVGKSLLKALDVERATTLALVDVAPRKIGQRIHGRRVIAPEGLSAYRGAVLLAAVGAAGAREEIRAAAQSMGYVDGVDFFACA